jgi:DNA mismatch repair protein MutS2
MKTLGLFVLMTQAGMHLPAARGSRIALYDQVFADIGDEQNMEASLSTFSAHMSQLKSIVSRVTSRSLVLLDELGSGTDPSEGGALAAAILDFLREKGCAAVITTHLSVLKTYAYNHTDVVNLSVAFDPVTLRPTFNLIYGVPGISNALAIAKNIGIPPAILQRAGTYMTDSDKQVVELIRGLEKTERAISETRTALQSIKQSCLQYQEALEGLVDSIRSRKEKILKNFEASARALLHDSEEKLMKIIKDQKRRRLIRPDEVFKQNDEVREAVAEVRQALVKKFPPRDIIHQHIERLDVGQTVSVPHLLRTGVVLSADNKTRRAEVLVGTMRVKLGFEELAPVVAPEQPRPSAKQAPAQEKPPPNDSAPMVKQVNVIGMRVADAMPLVDKAIDNALLQDADTVEIIHGRGTGRLMRAIHEHLKDHQCVREFTSGDLASGGTGVTVVHIKN